MRNSVLLNLLFFLSSVTLVAQTGDVRNKTLDTKCNPELNQYLQLHKIQSTTTVRKALVLSSTADSALLVIYCNDRAAVEAYLNEKNIPTRHIIGNTLTANIPLDMIEDVAGLDAVNSLSGFQHHELSMDKAREVTNADDVQNGVQLETPYTGKGVVIGFIDQGFQYDHPAFRVSEDSTRIIATWNANGKSQPVYGSSNILAAGDDGLFLSHATHVAGIAAGGNVMGSKTYYGMAPEAHLIMVRSDALTDAEIFNGISFIKQTAEQLGEPYVVNMSFGDTFCPHDGTNDLSSTMEELASAGLVAVAAAGNDGDVKLHAYYDFKETDDTCLLVIDLKQNTKLSLYVLGDDHTDFAAEPFLYNSRTGAVMKFSADVWQRTGNIFNSGVSSRNQRYYYTAVIDLSHLVYDATFLKNACLVIKITGSAGHHIDAFLSAKGVAYANLGGSTVCAPCDNVMSVGTPADSKGVFAVGAYVSRLNWMNIGHVNMEYASNSKVGDLADFSSLGPSTDASLLKPEVCAPGMLVCSSIKKNSTEYANIINTVCEAIELGGKKYYYGVMKGTSMSTPAVAGIIALWLQANPTLRHDDILDIIRKSSVSDQFTGTTWNSSWGYGKINAYAGLKLALKTAGVNDVKNSEQPISIQKDLSGWRILFNSSESFADIILCTLDGKVMESRHITDINRGDEQTFSFSALSSGVYALKIQTRNSVCNKKVCVK